MAPPRARSSRVRPRWRTPHSICAVHGPVLSRPSTELAGTALIRRPRQDGHLRKEERLKPMPRSSVFFAGAGAVTLLGSWSIDDCAQLAMRVTVRCGERTSPVAVLTLGSAPPERNSCRWAAHHCAARALVQRPMMRTKRGVLGAPRKSSQRAANATVETESGRLLLLAERRCSQSEVERFRTTKPRVTMASTRPNPREPGLPQLVVDIFAGFHGGLYARLTRAD